jgi:hypothetical protein
MQGGRLVATALAGVVSGYAGIKLMGIVTAKMYEWESEEELKREEAVRPGWPDQIAARKVAKAFGKELDDAEAAGFGKMLRYGTGMAWAQVYTFAREPAGMHPIAACLLTSLSMWSILDEGLTPALGLSAPNSAYPFVTHLRGLAGHLAYGLGVMLTAEALRVTVAWASRA